MPNLLNIAESTIRHACAELFRSRVRGFFTLFLLIIVLGAAATQQRAAFGQVGGHKLFGDLRVDESKVSEAVPLSYDVLLYSMSGNMLQRTSIPNRGRYQFLGLADGQYDVVVEVENKVVARVRVLVSSPFRTDFRQDIELEWRSPGNFKKTSAISADEFYKRTPANEKLFRDGLKESANRKYDQAASDLRRVVANDSYDFQAWAELANVHFLQRNFDEAENEYLHAIDARPGFFLALFNLGRLEIVVKKYDVAAEALLKAVKSKPESPDANYFLGDAYMRIKKGSLAVGYLNEALRLDPDGMAEVHLQLAMLYRAAALRDKAAAEYEEFLKKRPDYRDRKKLEQYIAESKKQRAAR
jgi:tetratricopeptide (TPR) repeat protein